MSKLPFMQFYVGDWFREPGLRMSPLYVKGAWADILFSMFDQAERGTLSGTLEDFGKMLSVEPWGLSGIHGSCSCVPWSGCEDCFGGSALDIIRQLLDRKVCDVEFGDGLSKKIIKGVGNFPASVTPRDIFVTLINRRMHREHKASQNHRKRQDKYRNKQGDGGSGTVGDAKVTGDISEVIDHKSEVRSQSSSDDDPHNLLSEFQAKFLIEAPHLEFAVRTIQARAARPPGSLAYWRKALAEFFDNWDEEVVAYEREQADALEARAGHNPYGRAN